MKNRQVPVDYEEVGAKFYDEQTDSKKVGSFRAWYHTARYSEMRRLVNANYKKGLRVVDLGCGSCVWNTTKIPVLGVDVNEEMLKVGVKSKRLASYRKASIYQTGLPGNSQDLAILSEVLEHLPDYPAALKEIRRILKPNGKFIITVPYDVPLSPFFFLFNLHCLLRGHVLGDKYYKNFCGHVNHFGRASLRKALHNSGFKIEKLYIFNGFLLHAVCQKP
ncbi:class I SAM-dependent methyltransferase [Candidatus Micrarchaeota archaeon]|nr:class I SAM-dependent methyltransferase [Candidatus Micrarchaeota archaeon]